MVTVIIDMIKSLSAVAIPYLVLYLMIRQKLCQHVEQHVGLQEPGASSFVGDVPATSSR